MMNALDQLENESVYSEDSYSGKLKPDGGTAKLALDMLRTCFNLSAITEAFPKVDPVGSRINNAWLVLSKTVQSFGDDLLPTSEKSKALEDQEKKFNKYERQKKQKTGGTGGSIERAFTEGEMISARFQLNVGVSKKGGNELPGTIEDVLVESKLYESFIDAKYWNLAKRAFRKFNEKYVEIDSWEERLVAINKAAHGMREEAKDRLEVYYSYHSLHYKFIRVNKVYGLHLSDTLEPLLFRLDTVTEMLKTLREKVSGFGLKGFRELKVKDQYVVNLGKILEEDAFRLWEPSQHRLIFVDKSFKKVSKLKIRNEVKLYVKLLQEHNSKLAKEPKS